jgi:hypothetical protein
VLLCGAAPAGTQEPSAVRIESLHIDLELSETGVRVVTETMVLITREPEP